MLYIISFPIESWLFRLVCKTHFLSLHAGYFWMFLSSAIFFKIQEYLQSDSSLDPDQAQQNTGPRSAVGNVSATDACLTADPGVASSIPARYHTFVEIDHEIISEVILLPSADLFKKGCCQLQAKVCAQITG